MQLRALIGAGDKIMGCTIPFAVVATILNIIYPDFFRVNAGSVGMIVGLVLLIAGVPMWLTSVVQVLLYVPRNKLITAGPFAVVRHPLYTSVAFLVIPGIGLLFDTWVGILIGVVLYIFSRRFAVREEKNLNDLFSNQYELYKSKVLLPWV